MNRALPEMIHCLNTIGNLAGNGMEVSVLEKQRARMKWQQEQLQQQQSYVNQNELSMFSMSPHVQQFQVLINNESGINEFVSRAMKPDPDVDHGWPHFGKFGGEDSDLGSCGFGNGSEFEMNYAISTTTGSLPAVAAAIAEAAVTDTEGRQPSLPDKLSSAAGRESFRKRKAGKSQKQKVVAEDDTREKKRIKGCAEEGESKITEQNSNNKSTTTTNNNNNRETSTETSKENSKVSEVQKPDYIHVRARRGQATDSHSLAERVRREKISERMKYLQDLVPGCNKITGKAGMLDEIINYVQSLQRQVEFLSMKLAAVNPRLDFNIDHFTKEAPAYTSNFPVAEGPSEMANPAYLDFNPLQQLVSCCGMDVGINPPDMAFRKTLSAPQIQHYSTWDADLQNLYGVEFHQGRSPSFPSQQFIGSIEASNLKMEM